MWTKNLRLAKIHEIHKHSFLCAFTKNLRRPHNCPTPISSKFRIILAENVEYSTQKLQNQKWKSIAINKNPKRKPVVCTRIRQSDLYTSALMQIKQATSSGRSTTSTVNHPLCQFNPSPSTDSYIRTHTDLNCPWT